MEESPAVSSSVLQTGAAAPIFKRKKRGASARPRPLGRLDSASPGPQSDANDAQDEDSEATRCVQFSYRPIGMETLRSIPFVQSHSGGTSCPQEADEGISEGRH